MQQHALKPNSRSARMPTNGAPQAAMAPSKERSKAYICTHSMMCHHTSTSVGVQDLTRVACHLAQQSQNKQLCSVAHVSSAQAASSHRLTMFRSSGGTISAKMGLLHAGAAAAMHRPMKNRTTAYRAVAPTDVPSSGRPCNQGPKF